MVWAGASEECCDACHAGSAVLHALVALVALFGVEAPKVKRRGLAEGGGSEELLRLAVGLAVPAREQGWRKRGVDGWMGGFYSPRHKTGCRCPPESRGGWMGGWMDGWVDFTRRMPGAWAGLPEQWGMGPRATTWARALLETRAPRGTWAYRPGILFEDFGVNQWI